ncbi:MAG: HD domain-containing protein [Sedimentisphaerales bacterium]|nr:HD domain-containing protein [Sedimentisphaerales bacterium]
MDRQQFAGLFSWFDSYVASFYGPDTFANANLKLKEDHSRRTVGEMSYLAQSLGFNDNDAALAEAIGLLHDIGRFEQFAIHRTYNDGRSENHCLLGRKVLRDKHILAGLDQLDMGIIETAVEYHGAKELPPGMTGRRLLFTKLIRDADKIDIYEVMIPNYKKYVADPKNFHLEIEFPQTGQCSPDVVEMVLKGERVDYRKLKTMDDAKLLQMGWVYDVNFRATLRRIKERRYMEAIAEMLPQTPQIIVVCKSILAFVNDHANRQGNNVREHPTPEPMMA